MITKFLVAVAVFAVSPAFVFSQDLFVLFDQGENGTNTANATTADGSGSAYVYSRLGFDYDAIYLDFSSSDTDVFEVTGGEFFNPSFSIEGLTGCARFIPGTTVMKRPLHSENFGIIAFSLGFEQIDLTDPANTTDIENTFGVKSGLAFYDPGFDPLVGPEGAFLLARVDFDIVGEGTANLDLGLPWGEISVGSFVGTGIIYASPTLESATLTVTSSVTVLGDANLDGVANFFDIPEFVSILSAGAYQDEVDCNADGHCDFFDIKPFVDCLSNH